VAPPIGLNVLARAGLILTPSTGRSRVSEEIGVTQQQVLRAVQAADAAEARSRVVLITSAHPGEGKTFTALNLAAASAAGGSHPVVLVDADGKKGSLSETLGMADSTGLRTLATDSRRHPRSMLMPTAVPRMWLLPYGAPVPGKPEVPPGTAVAAALRRVAEAMPGHLVLLDSPPCLSTSDPSTLATIAGQVILVVEAERTQRSEVEASLDLVEACPVLQLLLNKARLTDSDTFGAYVGAYAGH
jgi:receptor protein-tyrosine kinase